MTEGFRHVHLTITPEGTISSQHDGHVINFHTPQELWNFCTLDVSRDRQFYARPRTRNEEEEREAIEKWLSVNRKKSPEEKKAEIMRALRETWSGQKGQGPE